MLDLFRLGHKIGPFDEFDWRAAARDNDVLHGRPSLENRQDRGAQDNTPDGGRY